MDPLLFLLVLGVTPSVSKAGGHENTCNVVPKDLYIEAGSSIEIVCLTSCVRGKIYWTLDNKPMDESWYNTTNSTHAVLSLRNFTLPRATLQCHSNDTHHILGGTTIKTYLKPSNLSCFFHYTNVNKERSTADKFTCSWEHQVDPSLRINYTVLCTSSSCADQGQICNPSKNHQKTCTDENIGHKIPLTGSHSVAVKAQSAVWEATSDPFEFEPLYITKIPHPELSSVTPSSESLVVRWKIRAYSRHEKYHCRVKYSKAVSEGNPEWVLSKVETYNQEIPSWNLTTEKLEPCSNYTVAVRCRLNEGPWSDWSLEKTVLTKLKKSDYEPSLWRRVAEVEKNGVRRVHAMWREIPSTCQDTFHYSVKQTLYKENTTGVNYTAALCDDSVCDVNQVAHTITLEVFLNDSLFARDSVYVPAVGESLPEVTGIQTNSTPEGILLSWRAPAQPVSGYMIDYTHNGNQYYWEETNHTNAILHDLLDKMPYNITVTPLFDNKTGHGTQVLQVCSTEGDPGNVNISVVPGHRSADVSWNVKPQGACSGVVVSFTIFYRIGQEPELNVTASSKSHHTLQDLTPETQYSVYVKATARTGTTKSEEKSFKTTRFDPHFRRTLIICGTLLIFLVLSVGLCCAVQWKKFKDKLVPDPGRSTVALLASTSQNMGTCTFEPSESICNSIYIEEDQTAPTPLPDTGCNENPASDQTRGYEDPAIAPATDRQTEEPVEPIETQPPFSPGESTQLLSSESGLTSPYRSQSPQETPSLKTSKQLKRIPVKQPEKMPPLSVYVSLDMFEQGQGR